MERIDQERREIEQWRDLLAEAREALYVHMQSLAESDHVDSDELVPWWWLLHALEELEGLRRDQWSEDERLRQPGPRAAAKAQHA